MSDLNKEVIRNQVLSLLERRLSVIQGGEPPSPSYNPMLEITHQFEKLSQETGVSVAALEFLANPIGIVDKGVKNLTRAEQGLEDLNVEWATELRNAGLL